MSTETAKLLSEFETLPVEEKQEFVREVINHLPPWDSGPLSDDVVVPPVTPWLRASTRMNAPPRRGEVWLFDCGMVAKVRPVLILSIPFARPSGIEGIRQFFGWSVISAHEP